MADKRKAALIKETGAMKRAASTGASPPSSFGDDSLKTVKDQASMMPAAVASSSTLLLMTEGDPETTHSAKLLQHMARSKMLRSQAGFLIERMRASAQPNPDFRRQRLVAGDVGQASERSKFVMALKETQAGTFGDQPVMVEYMQELIAMEEQVDKDEDIFLRQVMIYCIPPFRSYIDIEFPGIVEAYDQLEKRRREYDNVRRKVGKQSFRFGGGPNSEAEQRLRRVRDVLVDQANTLEKYFENAPKTQMAFAKAIATFVMVEAAFYSKMAKLTAAIKGPSYHRRWNSKK